MPRTKEQFEEMRIKSKNNIIQAALKLFSQKGYHATSTNAIAKEAGIAAGLMYNYYKSKEELLVDIINLFFQDLIGSVARDFDGNHKLLDIGIIIDKLIEQIEMNRERWSLLISIMFQPDISKLCSDQFEKFSSHQTDFFRTCFEQKGINRPEESARVLSSVLHGAFLGFAASGDIEELRLLRNTVIERILDKGI